MERRLFDGIERTSSIIGAGAIVEGIIEHSNVSLSIGIIVASAIISIELIKRGIPRLRIKRNLEEKVGRESQS